MNQQFCADRRCGCENAIREVFIQPRFADSHAFDAFIYVFVINAMDFFVLLNMLDLCHASFCNCLIHYFSY